jgi:hypothetical protein
LILKYLVRDLTMFPHGVTDALLNVERFLVRKLASNACHEHDSINGVATAI